MLSSNQIARLVLCLSWNSGKSEPEFLTASSAPPYFNRTCFICGSSGTIPAASRTLSSSVRST